MSSPTKISDYFSVKPKAPPSVSPRSLPSTSEGSSFSASIVAKLTGEGAPSTDPDPPSAEPEPKLSTVASGVIFCPPVPPKGDVAEGDKKKKEPRRKACGECKTCIIDKDCGTCKACLKNAEPEPPPDPKNPKKRKKNTRKCETRVCLVIKYKLDPAGAVGEDGYCDYCFTCGPAASYLSDEEDVPGTDATEEDDDAPVPALSMLCCDLCPRAFHAKCCLPDNLIVAKSPSPLTFRMPEGDWVCDVCKAEKAAKEKPAKRARVSKPKEKVQNSFLTTGTSKKQATLTGLVTGGVKIPKKIITEVKLPDPKALQDYDFVKRNPDFVISCHFLSLAEGDLKMRLRSKALEGVAGNYFPIDDLEIALSGLTSSDAEKAYDILQDMKENDQNPLKDYYERVSDIEDDHFEAASQLRNLIFHRLLISKSTRSSTKVDDEPCSAYDCFQMLKSRLIMWYVLVECGLYEYKCRIEEEEEMDVDSSDGDGSPEKPEKAIEAIKIPEGAAKALKMACKMNTNVAGGGPKFKKFLDKACSECRILKKQIEGVLKVFKTNSSGKAKSMLKDILNASIRGDLVEEGEAGSAPGSAEASAEEGPAEENETAENTEESDPEAEVSEEEGDDDDDDDEDFEGEDLGHIAPVAKPGPPPRDKKKDAAKMEEIMSCADPDKTDSVVALKYLQLLNGKDLDTAHSVIVKTFRSFYTADDLLQHITAYEMLTTQIPRDLLDSFLVPSFAFLNLTATEKVKCLKVLCDSLLIHDETIQFEIKGYDKSELNVVPKYYDAYGRAYFYINHLQPMGGVRMYRTFASWDEKSSTKKALVIKENSALRFKPHPPPPSSSLPSIPYEHDKCLLWEVAAENVEDVDKLLSQKDCFYGNETNVLKSKLKELKLDLEYEINKLSGHIERERKKEILRNMPRRISSRSRGTDVSYKL